MTNLKKAAVLAAVIIGIMVLYTLVDRFNQRDDFLRVYKVYKEKGKSTQFNMEDIRKGFK